MKGLFSMIAESWIACTFLSIVLFILTIALITSHTMVSEPKLGVITIASGVGGHIIWRKFKDPPVIKPILPYWIFNIARLGFTIASLIFVLNYFISIDSFKETYKYETETDS